MNASKLLPLLLALGAVFVFVVAMFFFFAKKQGIVGSETTPSEPVSQAQPASECVLNVVTFLPNDRVEQLKASLGGSALFDARVKANSYTSGQLTVNVVSGELSDLPGYTKYTHTLPRPFKGSKLVFDMANSVEFFEDPVSRLTAYFWFDTLLLLTLTTQTEGENPVAKNFHFSAHFGGPDLRWDRLDRDPATPLDLAFLAVKLDELNVAAGNVVALGLDEYLDASTGTYSTELDSVTSTFTLNKRSSSQTGFVKLTHKLNNKSGSHKPFKLKKLLVSGSELTDLAVTKKPVLSASVFWWYNMPLVCELALHGGAHEQLVYNFENNRWEKEVVENLRSKLFLLKNKLGDPLTLDLSKGLSGSDETYTSSGVLVKVSPGTTAAQDFKKFTHRFSSGNSHLVGSFSNNGMAQLSLPVVRLNEVVVYYFLSVPLLLKMNLATAGGFSNKDMYYQNNGLGVWKRAVLDEKVSNTTALLKKLAEENRELAKNQNYVFDAKMKSRYLSNGKVVSVTQETSKQVEGFTTFTHSPVVKSSFNLDKFTLAGKDLEGTVRAVQNVASSNVYWFLDQPLLLELEVNSPSGPVPLPQAQPGPNTLPSGELPPLGPPGVAPEGTPQPGVVASTAPTVSAAPGPAVAASPSLGSSPAGLKFYYNFDATLQKWARVDEKLDTTEKLKAVLNKSRSTLGSVSVNLGHNSGVYKSGPVSVTVADVTSFDNDPPTSFTKRVHTFSLPFPVDKFKHFDFDLVLGKSTTGTHSTAHLENVVTTNDPLLPSSTVVQKVEVYFFGDVPLYFLVYGTLGKPVRFFNTFKGTVWVKDAFEESMSLKDLLLLLRVRLGHTAVMDVCKGAADDTLVTYNLKYLAAEGTTPVTVSRKDLPGSDGVREVKHVLPEGVSLKFSSLRCKDRLLTGLNNDELHTVFVYYRKRLPMFVKTNSDPKYFAMSGDGLLTRFVPQQGATLTDQQLTQQVTDLSRQVGKVFDVDVSKKEKYTLQDAEFAVDREQVAGFDRFKHELRTSGGPEPFTVKSFLHGERDAVVFSTGLKVDHFSVYYNNDKPLYLQLKAHGPTGKFYHFVHDNGLWLEDGVYDTFDDEEVGDRLFFLKDGLGNEFSLDLGEDVDSPVFNVDFVDFDLVPGFKKYTYKPVGMDYPFLLGDLTLGGQPVKLPMEDRHLSTFTAYSYRKNYLFFHVVTHDNRDLFFKSNLSDGFEPVNFDRFDDNALKLELRKLKDAVSNQVSLELTKMVSYPYHNFNVNVVLQTQNHFTDYKKYLHDLVDGTTSVPFKLVSVKDDGYVTNVPLFNELVYFAYVYHHDNRPLLLELHSSNKNMTGYHYYYFANNLGNWELLENPSLGQLQNSKLREVLNDARDKLSKTFKVDLARKFPSRLLNGWNNVFHLDVNVVEDVRETLGFSMYSHTFTLNRPEGTDAKLAPTASNLGGTTVVRPTPTTPAPTSTATPTPTVTAPSEPAVPSTGTTETAGSAAAQVVTAVAAALNSSVGRGAVPTAVSLPSEPTPQTTNSPEAPNANATPALNTYQTLMANALRGVNVMSAQLPVVGKFALGNVTLSGFGVDTLYKANVYWWRDHFPAFVHVFNGVNNKYYRKKGDGWVMCKKSDSPLSRAELLPFLEEVKASLVRPVDLDLDKSSDFESYVRYVSEGHTLRVVPSHSFEDFKGFTHFSAKDASRAFKVKTLSLWGDVVTSDVQDGFVKRATVFTDGDLLPLAVELEWTRLNNASFRSKFKYFKNSGTSGWVVHPTDNTSEKLTDDVLLSFLKGVKDALGQRVVLSLEKRENYGVAPSAVTVTRDPATTAGDWNGYHKVTHALNNANARLLVMKMGDRVVRAFHTDTHVKNVETYWYKNALLLVKLTVAGAPSVGSTGSTADTYKFFKNDEKDDLVPVDSVDGLDVTTPSPNLVALAEPFTAHYHLDVGERTLKNRSDVVKLVPAVYVVDTSVPAGFARYNLYVLDHVDGLKLGKLLYHGTDFSTGNLPMPEHKVHSVYAFTPVGHFSPFFLELHLRSPTKLLFDYYHLNHYGTWVKLETGGRRLTNQELFDKLSLLSSKLGNVTVVDVAKTEGSYFGLTKMNVTKFEFPGSRGYSKYLHKAHDGEAFTVSKFVNKGLVLQNMPVLKATHVAVYATRGHKPLLLELKVGGRYKFFTSNANGAWYEESLPSGDLKSALDNVFDEHTDVARLSGHKLALQLSADFVREYVLTEGNVGDFEGAVAVPEQEPEEPHAPVAPRVLTDAVEEGEAAETPNAPVLQGATRPVDPPSETLTKSHVLNPLLYLDNDKLAYSYCSYGKSVFVTRRDDLFFNFNVTFHKLPDNEPFSVKKLVFLGRDFDLGLGNAKFLSATLFSFLHKPLLLKLVKVDGEQVFFSFNFSTQNWTLVTVDDVLDKLHHLNFEENKMLVLDLSKHTSFTERELEFVVDEQRFGLEFSRVATKLKAAADAKAKLDAKKAPLVQEKLKQKEALKLEAEAKLAKVNSLKDSANFYKEKFGFLFDEWKKVNSTKAGEYKTYLDSLETVAHLEKAVVKANEDHEKAKATNASDVELKKKLHETKKAELALKRAEVEKLKAQVAETVGATEATTTNVKTKLAAAVTAANQLKEAVKLTDKVTVAVTAAKALEKSDASPKLSEVTCPADKLDTLKDGSKLAELTAAFSVLNDAVLYAKLKLESGDKFSNAATAATSLQTEVEALGSLQDVTTEDLLKTAVDAVKKLKTALAEVDKLNLAYEAALDFKFAETDAPKLKEAVVAAEKVGDKLEVFLAFEGSKETEKLTKASEALKTLKGVVNDKLKVKDAANSVKTAHDTFKGLLVADHTEKFKAALESLEKLDLVLQVVTLLTKGVAEGGDSALTAKLNTLKDNDTKRLDLVLSSSDKFKHVLSLVDKLKELDPEFGKAVEEPATEPQSAAKKLKTFVDATNALVDELKGDAVKKVEEALLHLNNLKDAEDALARLSEVVPVAQKLKQFAAENLPVEPAETAAETALKPHYDKLKDAFKDLDLFVKAVEFVKKLGVVVATEDKLNKLAGGFKKVKVAFDAYETSTTSDKTEKLKEVAKKYKEVYDDLKTDDPTKELKAKVEQKKTELQGQSDEKLKLGVHGARKEHGDLLKLVPLAETEFGTAATTFRKFRTDVYVDFDDDDDFGPVADRLFGFGGLKLSGRSLSSAGLPVGNHLHTLNSYFFDGFEKPLMLQLKYFESDDVDEPVPQPLTRPPPAEALSTADLSSATEPAAQANSTVAQVSHLLNHGLTRVTPTVTAENATVVTPASNPTEAPASSSAPVQDERAEELEDDVVYPGNFFVLETDGTWKAFAPEGRGALRAKLEDLVTRHGLRLTLDLGKVPEARKGTTYTVNRRNFVMRRLLYSNGYKFHRDPASLQGTTQPVKPKLVNLADFDSSVKFFPPAGFKWFVHHLTPTMGQNNKVLDSLPHFTVDRLDFNGHHLNLPEGVLSAPVNSVSVLTNNDGVPLLLFLYKPSVGSVVQHRYFAYVFDGEKFVSDQSFVNHDLLHKLEHTNFDWNSDPSFPAFVSTLSTKLNEWNRSLEPGYEVDLSATKHYKRDDVVVNVDVRDAFGVRHVSYTPGLLVPNQSPLPSTVPSFVAQKVFSHDTTFTGFDLPWKNVLHVTAFQSTFLRPLKDNVSKEFLYFPLLLEFSLRNENNRLEHFYFRYMGGANFELHARTKFRLTASEVSDVVKLLALDNLSYAKANAALKVNFEPKSTHYTPKHLVTVDKMEKSVPVVGAPASSPASPTNAFLPDGYSLFKYSLSDKDTPYTSLLLFFSNFWNLPLTKLTYTNFYLYVRVPGELPDLLALESPGAGTNPTYEWFGLRNNVPTRVFENDNVSPTNVSDKAKVEAKLAELTAHEDFFFSPRRTHWEHFTTQLNVKLSPVGNVEGFPLPLERPAPTPLRPAGPAMTVTA